MGLRYPAAHRALVNEIRQELWARQDPAKAPQMQRYMKSDMPYLGVQSAGVREVCKIVFAAHPLSSSDPWHDSVLAIWEEATHREERYAAIALAGDRAYRSFRTPEVTGMYEHLIVTGAWWDYVDTIAIHQLGPMLRSFQDEVSELMLTWAQGDNTWKRRTAIICQVGAKGDTDVSLLHRCIEPSLGDREFFIPKAIGWALRHWQKQSGGCRRIRFFPWRRVESTLAPRGGEGYRIRSRANGA